MEILQEKSLLYMLPFLIHAHGDSPPAGDKGQTVCKICLMSRGP